LAAAERAFRLEPAGMLFCGLKKSVHWDGWHASLPGLESVGMLSTPGALRDMMHAAEDAARRVHERILAGRIAPDPADPQRCARCDYRDICRVESIATAAEQSRRVGGA
jgi:hypothetical protein